MLKYFNYFKNIPSQYSSQSENTQIAFLMKAEQRLPNWECMYI